jgi:hypothetical protein
VIFQAKTKESLAIAPRYCEVIGMFRELFMPKEILSNQSNSFIRLMNNVG